MGGGLKAVQNLEILPGVYQTRFFGGQNIWTRKNQKILPLNAFLDEHTILCIEKKDEQCRHLYLEQLQ